MYDAPAEMLKYDADQFAETIESNWEKTKKLSAQLSSAQARRYVLPAVLSVAAGTLWLTGNHGQSEATMAASVAALLYLEIRLIRLELNIALQNQIIAQLTMASFAKTIVDEVKGASRRDDTE